MSMVAVFKLECLKIKHHLNHFALRVKVFIKANLTAMSELKNYIMLCVTLVNNLVLRSKNEKCIY